VFLSHSYFLLELVFRTLYIAEEYHHLVTRYENSYWTLLKDTFYFSPTIGIIFIVSLFTCLFMYMNHGEVPHRLWYNLGVVSLTSSLLSALVLQRNANLVRSSKKIVTTIIKFPNSEMWTFVQLFVDRKFKWS
jgi:hypothetical protein